MRLNLKDKPFMIYQAFKSKIPLRDISNKSYYSISGIRKIINMYNQNEHSIDIPEINIIGKAVGLRESEIKHIQKTLQKYGYSGRDNGWKDLLPEDLYEIPNLDPWYVDIIWLAQHIDP